MHDALSRKNLLLAAAALAGTGVGLWRSPAEAASGYAVALSDVQWRARLTPEQYAVLRESGTEAPASSALLGEHRSGIFVCAACANPLFDAATKFESGTGWPSFFRARAGAIATTRGVSFMGMRTEVHCRRCGSRLGHVFDDGPQPTGLRYCMNGVALAFHPQGRRTT
ncbi:MAG: peptide-methionine (R)-S-oxide reductase MsrB [Vulcanimicrobiaceae bacterium]